MLSGEQLDAHKVLLLSVSTAGRSVQSAKVAVKCTRTDTGCPVQSDCAGVIYAQSVKVLQICELSMRQVFLSLLLRHATEECR